VEAEINKTWRDAISNIVLQNISAVFASWTWCFAVVKMSAANHRNNMSAGRFNVTEQEMI